MSGLAPLSAEDLLTEARAGKQLGPVDVDTFAALLVELPAMLACVLDQAVSSFPCRELRQTGLGRAMDLLAQVTVILEEQVAHLAAEKPVKCKNMRKPVNHLRKPVKNR